MDPFATASQQVTDMRAEHAKLEKDIPHLIELQRGAKGDLDTILKRQASVLANLDKLNGLIKKRTEDFNLYVAQETEKLTAERERFRLLQESDTTEVMNRKQLLDERENRLNHKEQELIKRDGKLVSDEELLAARLAAVDKSTEDVTAREQKVADQEAQVTQDEATLADKLVKADKRESDTNSKKIEAENALKSAEIDRNAAVTLLNGTKSKIEAMDNREHDLDARELLQDQRKRELDTREAQLNDRQGVLDSH